LARKLRKYGTKGEAMLWREVLKSRQHWTYQFNRQFLIGNYIVDFICRSLKLLIEIGGSFHFAKVEEDYRRQMYLESKRYYYYDFSESQVFYRMDNVVADIDYAFKYLEESIDNRFKLK
jgi:very-short-patch-repair endonuclease